MYTIKVTGIAKIHIFCFGKGRLITKGEDWGRLIIKGRTETD